MKADVNTVVRAADQVDPKAGDQAGRVAELNIFNETKGRSHTDTQKSGTWRLRKLTRQKKGTSKAVKSEQSLKTN